MKNRKILELNSKVSLEAVVGETTELYFKVGNKPVRIADAEITELYNWIGTEVLKNVTGVSFGEGNAAFDKAVQTQIEKERLTKSLAINPESAKPIAFDQSAATRAFSKEHIFEGTPQG